MFKELIKRIVTSIIILTLFIFCLFHSNLSWLILLVIVSFLCLFEFICLIKKIWKNNLYFFLICLVSFIYLTFFTFISWILKIYGNEYVVIFILSICIFSDIGGYIIGKSLGGKKLTKISPNKTISGSLGSFIFSLLPLIYFQKIIADFNIAILFCFIISFLCQLGDLFISYFKRKAKVKDTGNVLPGHGGILDRIDGIIFAVPVTSIFIILYLLN